MKNILIGSSLVVAAIFLSACSDDKAAAPAANQGSTAVSIDTGDGSFSFKTNSDGDSTSVSVDAGKDSDKK
ncbi:hypothetical protein [Zhongshania arctica]|uniref:Uncharacterized protein n=1 Tax=Zhongshania arctica TaxID=3238302 RepID=A0ABV3TRW9_9GAMM